MKRLPRLLGICGFVLLSVVPARADTSVIDIMFVYTSSARAWADANSGGMANTINNGIALAQATIDNSNVAVTLNLVHSAEISYVESGDRLTDMYRFCSTPDFNTFGAQYDGYMDDVHTLRATYGADLVVLLDNYGNFGGFGNIPSGPRGSPDQAYAMVEVENAISYVIPHELGHTLGCVHSRNQFEGAAGPLGGIYPYSTGWRWIGTDSLGYCSVMTYPMDAAGLDTYTRAPMFSNPSLLYQGVATGSYDTANPQTGIYAPADNALSINNVRSRIAAYSTRVIDTQHVTIHHDSICRGQLVGPGINVGETHAARFDSTELTGHYGSNIIGIKLVTGEATVVLKIWRGGSVASGPGTLVYTEDISDSVWDNSWTTHMLTTPVALQSDTEYWIGYYIKSSVDSWIAGTDTGAGINTQVPNKGGWWMDDGGPWNQYNGFNLSIRMILDEVVDSTPPAAFTVLTPAANLDTNQTTLQFSWNLTTDTGSGMKNYTLQADTFGGSFSAPVAETTVGPAISTAPLTLPANDTYIWRVVARDSSGNTRATSSRIIRIDTVPPWNFRNLAPVEATETLAVSLIFSWTASGDSVAGLLRYRLQVDTGTSFAAPFVDSAVALSTTATRALPANDTYHWRVLAQDSAGNTTATADSVLVIDTQAPTTPALLLPANSTETNAVVISFTWTASSDSLSSLQGYRLQIDTTLTFTAPFVDSSTGTDTSGTRTLPANVNDTYYWRVVAEDDAGNTAAAAPNTLVIDTSAAVTLLAPSSGSVRDSRPTFQWAGPSAETFVVQVATDTTFLTILDSTVTTTTTWIPQGLESGAYVWRVAGYDRLGNVDTAQAWQLRIDTGLQDTTAPLAFSLLAPANGLETQETNIRFQWGAAVDSSSITYNLQICTSAAFVSLVVDTSWLSATSCTITLNANDTYVWRVIAKDAFNNRRSSTETWSLVVDTAGPSVPTIVAPKNGDTKISPVLLDWSTSTDSLSGVNRYRVQIDTAGTFTGALVADSYQTSPDTTLPLGVDTYYWRVLVYDDAGCTAASTTESFRVIVQPDTTAPSAFSLSAPSNGTETSTTTIAFRWNAAADSHQVTYRLLVDNDSTFGSPAVDTSWLSAASCTVAVPANDTYYWKVAARDTSLNVRWSTETRTLIVDTAGPSAPTIVAPRNGDTRLSPVLLDWNPSSDTVSGFLRYRMQISLTSSFAGSLVVDTYQTVSDTTLTLAVDTYYWRVIAYDDASNTTAVSPESFRVVVPSETAPPSVFALSSPANSTETTATAIRFAWNAATDSTAPVSYRLQVSASAAFGTTVVDTSWLSATNATVLIPANSVYYWRVFAWDGLGNLRQSTETWMIVVDTAGPTVPTIVVPKNGDTRTSPVLLDWNASTDTLSGFKRYRLQIDRVGTFAGAMVADSYQVTPDTTLVLAVDTYYWRVLAYDSLLNSSTSTTESFRIVIPPETVPPSVFSLTGPTNSLETTSTAIRLTWGTATDPSAPVTYRLQVATNASFTISALDTSWLASTSCIAALPANNRYYWRVTAMDAVGNTRTSTETWSFVIDTAGPTTPALTAHAGARETAPITFKWTASTDALTSLRNYRLQVSTSSGFGVLTMDSYTTATETSALIGIDTYWWRVLAYDTLGNSTTSSTDSTKVIACPESTVPTVYSFTASRTSVQNSGTDTIQFSLTGRDSSGIVSVLLRRSGLCDTTTLSWISDSLYRSTVTVASSISAQTYMCSAIVQDVWGNRRETFVTITVTNSSPSYSSISTFGGDSVTIYGPSITLAADTTVPVSQFLYEYRSHTSGGAWIPCVVIPLSRANPVTASPWSIIWDMSSLAQDAYEVRATGTTPAGQADTHASAVLVTKMVSSSGAAVLTADGATWHTETYVFRAGTQDSRTLFDGTRLTVPAGALGADAQIGITYFTSAPTDAPAPTNGLRIPGGGAYRRFDFASGANFLADVIITIPYSDSGLTAADPQNLSLYTYAAGGWQKVDGSTVDTVQKTVTARVRHFSFFAPFATGAAANLSGVVVFPNPFVPHDAIATNGVPYTTGDNSSGIIFGNLPNSVGIEIYTINGQRIAFTTSSNTGGSLRWDARDEAGHEAASGVYIAVITASTGERVVKKVMIVR